MYGVIEIPEFPLQAALRGGRRPRGGALAVVEGSGRRARVVAANAKARKAGVETGMTPARALARRADLQWVRRVPEGEQSAGRVLLLFARTLGPRVEETEAGLVTVDLRGMERGRWLRLEAVLRDLVERVRTEAGLRVRIGVSDTPDLARWAALAGRPVRVAGKDAPVLRELPLERIGVGRELASILEGWGVRTLGELNALPRDSVGARLGGRGLDLWDRARGKKIRLLRTAEPAPRFSRAVDFEEGVATMGGLLFSLRRLVDELALELEAACRAAFVLTVGFRLADRAKLEKRMELPEPGMRASTLFRTLETGLEGLRTEAAVTGIALELATVKARPRQGDLFAGAMKDPSGFAETMGRIAGMLGPGRSGFPRKPDGWRPDAFRLEVPEDEGAEAGKRSAGVEEKPAAYGRELPLERWRPPRAIRVLFRRGRPAALRGTGLEGTVTRARGPLRLSGDWWEAGRAWTREEWDVELEDGCVYRIFNDRCAWYAEGWYG